MTVAKDGASSDPAWDPEPRLRANLGDLLLVCGDDVAAMRVTEIVEPGWNERWRVERVAGACRDGSVLVMSAAGLQPRRKARRPKHAPSLAALVAARAAEVRGAG